MTQNIEVTSENVVSNNNVDDAEKELRRQERAVSRAVRRLLSQSYTRNAERSYEIGALIVGLKSDGGKYGKGSIGRVAKKVGCTAALLYQYASVAGAWTKEEFDQELAKASENSENGTEKGLPLTFSHFAAVAEVRDADSRTAFLALARRDSLSVRDLARKVREATPAGDTPRRTGRQVLGHLVTSSSRMLERAKADIESLAGVDVADDSADQLQLALETYTAMRVAAEQVERRLAELLVQAKKQEPAADEAAPSSNDAPESVASRPEIGAMHRYIAR